MSAKFLDPLGRSHDVQGYNFRAAINEDFKHYPIRYAMPPGRSISPPRAP
jgi:hypothetical protein